MVRQSIAMDQEGGRNGKYHANLHMLLQAVALLKEGAAHLIRKASLNHKEVRKTMTLTLGYATRYPLVGTVTSTPSQDKGNTLMNSKQLSKGSRTLNTIRVLIWPTQQKPKVLKISQALHGTHSKLPIPI